MLILISIAIPFYYCTQGYVDMFYQRFTAHKNTNIILGSSRSSQGFNPEILFDNSGLNFSFTNSISPYGRVYFNAIQKVTQPGPGYAVLEVCPLVFCEIKKAANDESAFRENKLMVGNMNFYGLDPNPEYIFKNHEKPLYKLLLESPYEKTVTLHKNGWLQVTDTSTHNYSSNVKNNVFYLSQMFADMIPAKIRIQWFQKTIKWLQSQDKQVIIVRLPIAKELLDMEEAYWPQFNSTIGSIADSTHVQFLNLSADTSYFTHDGSHLKWRSANQLSKQLKEWSNWQIKQHK